MSADPLDADLFPNGSPSSDEAVGHAMEQYKLMLGTVESLESRRQTLHQFFMSINSLFLAAIGLVGKESLDSPGVGVGVILLGIAGSVLSFSWRQQIASHGNVARSKWEVINHFEQALPTRPFCAEYAALVRHKYRSFTQVERVIPTAFIGLYLVSIAAGILLAFEVV